MLLALIFGGTPGITQCLIGKGEKTTQNITPNMLGEEYCLNYTLMSVSICFLKEPYVMF